jgi:drug/metabolite transporter (DMT)-like permease
LEDKKPYIALFISIAAVSTAAILIVSVSEDVPPLTIAFYRLLFTVILLCPAVLFFKKTRKELFHIPKKTLLLIFLIGIILAVHFAFWITSLDYTSVASSVILVTAHPVLVAPVAHYFLKEKLGFINVLGIILSLFGVVILVLGNYGLGSLSLDSVEGNILAILGGVAAGLYILGGRKVRKTVSVVSYGFIVYSISTIILFCLCIITKSRITSIEISDYEIFIFLALISGIFGHTFYNWSLKHIRASVASVTLLGEPIGSTILAFIIPWINQIPSNYTVIGGIIIFLGIYLTAKEK